MSIEAEIARNYEKGALLSFDRNLSYENKEFLEKAIAPHPLSFENSFPIIRIEYHPAFASFSLEFSFSRKIFASLFTCSISSFSGFTKLS